MDKKIVEKYPCKECVIMTICTQFCDSVTNLISIGGLISEDNNTCVFCGSKLKIIGHKKVCTNCAYIGKKIEHFLNRL